MDGASVGTGTARKTFGNIVAGSHTVRARITLGSYQADTKDYNVTVTGGQTAYRDVWWDKVNLNVTVNGSPITSGFTIKANGQTHSLLSPPHTVIGDGKMTSYVVTYQGMTVSDSKTYGQIQEGLDFAFQAATQSVASSEIFIPSIALISPEGEDFVFPIRVKLYNDGPDIITESRVKVRGSRFDRSQGQIQIWRAGTDTSFFEIDENSAGGFDFVVPRFPANAAITLEAHIVFRAPSPDYQSNAGRMLWEIQEDIGGTRWPSSSGESPSDRWTSGLFGKVWKYETAIFPMGLPEDAAGIDVQGACPTAIAIGNGIFTACLSKEGKIVFATFPTVGSDTQIPYETRPWSYCAKRLTDEKWSHDFGTPLPMGVFPGVRVMRQNENTGRVSWLVRDQWNRKGWTVRDPRHASPTGVQMYRSLDQKLEIKETAVVPFGQRGLFRIFEIKNLTSEPLKVSMLCSAQPKSV